MELRGPVSVFGAVGLLVITIAACHRRVDGSPADSGAATEASDRTVAPTMEPATDLAGILEKLPAATDAILIVRPNLVRDLTIEEFPGLEELVERARACDLDPYSIRVIVVAGIVMPRKESRWTILRGGVTHETLDRCLPTLSSGARATWLDDETVAIGVQADLGMLLDDGPRLADAPAFDRSDVGRRTMWTWWRDMSDHGDRILVTHTSVDDGRVYTEDIRRFGDKAAADLFQEKAGSGAGDREGNSFRLLQQAEEIDFNSIDTIGHVTGIVELQLPP